MHWNPVEKGLVTKPEDWPWSSFRCFGAGGDIRLQIDPLQLPADENAHL
jgi:hypothetical protein